jgi:hypothetical protein
LGGALSRRDGGFKEVVARLAFPDVSHPVIVDKFRPFGNDKGFAALGALDDGNVG